MTSQEATDYHP